jgi:hypothetical protein
MRILSGTRQRRLYVLVTIAVLSGLTMAAATTVSPSTLTKGPIPEAAWRADGSMDLTIVPDFIPALGRDGTQVGFVQRDLVLADQATRPSRLPPSATTEIPVLADDLASIVGHMVPGRGFVPLGVDPASVPEYPFVVSSGN